MFFHQQHRSPEVKAISEEVDHILGLRPGLREAAVRYGFIPANDSEIAMLTRSMLQIIIELALQIDVPAEHIAEGRTVGTPRSSAGDGDDSGAARLIRVKHSKEKPDDAFVSIKYRGYWYWIDDRDFRSKRTFTFVMVLMSLTETGGNEGMPLVTIPAG